MENACCLSTIPPSLKFNNKQLTVDFAFVKLVNGCVIQNLITIRGEEFRLKIATEMYVTDKIDVFTVDRNGKFQNGMLCCTDMYAGGFLGDTGITDCHGKSNTLPDSNSGALVMSLSDDEYHTAMVHGVVIGRFKCIRECGIVAVDIAIPLRRALQAAFQIDKVRKLLDGDATTEVDFCEHTPEIADPRHTGFGPYSFAEALAGIRCQLCKQIDIQHGFLRILLDCRVIIRAEYDDIRRPRYPASEKK